jgi:hypothetical protein
MKISGIPTVIVDENQNTYEKAPERPQERPKLCTRCNAMADKINRLLEENRQLRAVAVLKGSQ